MPSTFPRPYPRKISDVTGLREWLRTQVPGRAELPASRPRPSGTTHIRRRRS